MLTLFVDAYYISPYAFSCFVALREKGVAFEMETKNLSKREHREGDYPERSITGRVPALRERDERGDEFWLSESSAIIEYLDDRFPSPSYPRLLPSDARQRARARMVMAWVRSDLMPIRDERPTTTIFYQRAETPLSPAGEAAAARLVQAANALIPEGKTSLFDSWSAADADLALMLQRLALNGHAIPDKVRAFIDAQWARPSVRAWIDRERIPYVAY